MSDRGALSGLDAISSFRVFAAVPSVRRTVSFPSGENETSSSCGAFRFTGCSSLLPSARRHHAVRLLAFIARYATACPSGSQVGRSLAPVSVSRVRAPFGSFLTHTAKPSFATRVIARRFPSGERATSLNWPLHEDSTGVSVPFRDTHAISREISPPGTYTSVPVS